MLAVLHVFLACAHACPCNVFTLLSVLQFLCTFALPSQPQLQPDWGDDNRPASMALPILPKALSQLVVLNAEYKILICISNGCCCALKPTTLSRHLSIQHKTPIALQRQLEQYIAVFPCMYDYNTVVLPPDRSVLQPVIPIVDGFQYRACTFKTQVELRWIMDK